MSNLKSGFLPLKSASAKHWIYIVFNKKLNLVLLTLSMHWSVIIIIRRTDSRILILKPFFKPYFRSQYRTFFNVKEFKTETKNLTVGKQPIRIKYIFVYELTLTSGYKRFSKTEHFLDKPLSVRFPNLRIFLLI